MQSDSKKLFLRTIAIAIITILLAIVPISLFNSVEADAAKKTYTYSWKNWENIGSFKREKQIGKIVLLNTKTKKYVKNMGNEGFDLKGSNSSLNKSGKSVKNGNYSIHVVFMSVGKTVTRNLDEDITRTNLEKTSAKYAIYRSVGVTITDTEVKSGDLTAYFKNNKMGSIYKIGRFYEFDSKQYTAKTKYESKSNKIFTMEEYENFGGGKTGGWTYKSFAIPWKCFKTMCDTNNVDIIQHAKENTPIYLHNIMQHMHQGEKSYKGDKYGFIMSRDATISILKNCNNSDYTDSIKTYYNHKVYLPKISATVYVDSFYKDDEGKTNYISSSNYSYSNSTTIGSTFNFDVGGSGSKVTNKGKTYNLPGAYTSYYWSDIIKVKTRNTKKYLEETGKKVIGTDKAQREAFIQKCLGAGKKKTKAYTKRITSLKKQNKYKQTVDKKDVYYQVLYDTNRNKYNVTVEYYAITNPSGTSMGDTSSVVDLNKTKKYSVTYNSSYTVSSNQDSVDSPVIIKVPKNAPSDKYAAEGYQLIKVENSVGNSTVLLDSDQSNMYSTDTTFAGADYIKSSETAYDNAITKFYRSSAKVTSDITIKCYYVKNPAKQGLTINYINITNGNKKVVNTSLQNPYSKDNAVDGLTIKFKNTRTYSTKGKTSTIWLPQNVLDNAVGKQVYFVGYEFNGYKKNKTVDYRTYFCNKKTTFDASTHDNNQFNDKYRTGKQTNSGWYTFSAWYKYMLGQTFTHYVSDAGGTELNLYYSDVPGNVSVYYKKSSWNGTADMKSYKKYTISGVADAKVRAYTDSSSYKKYAIARKRGTAASKEQKWWLKQVVFQYGSDEPTSANTITYSGDVSTLGSSTWKTWYTNTVLSLERAYQNDGKDISVYFVFEIKSDDHVEPWVKYVDGDYSLIDELPTDDEVEVGDDYQFPSDYIFSSFSTDEGTLVLVDWKITIKGQDSQWTDTTYSISGTSNVAQSQLKNGAPDEIAAEAQAAIIKMTPNNATLWLVYDYDIEPPSGEPMPPETEVFEKKFEETTSGEVFAAIQDDDEIHNGVHRNDGYAYDLQSESGGIPTSDEVYTEAMAKKYNTAYQYQTTTGGYIYRVKLVYEEDGELVEDILDITREYSYNQVNTLDVFKVIQTDIYNDVLGTKGTNTVTYAVDDVEFKYTKDAGIKGTPSVASDDTIKSELGSSVMRIKRSSDNTGIAIRLSSAPDEATKQAIVEKFFGQYSVASDTLTGTVYNMDCTAKEEVTFLDDSHMTAVYVVPTNVAVDVTDSDESEEDTEEEEDTTTDGEIFNTDNETTIESNAYIKVSDEEQNHMIVVPDKLSNGEKKSKATTLYQTCLKITGGSVKSAAGKESYQVNTPCNDVWVHTPVVSIASTGVDEKNPSILQSLNLDLNEVNVSLGKTFNVSWSVNGNHKDALGYQVRDYSKYVQKITIVCPFEVKYNNGYYDKGEEIVVFDKDVEGEGYDTTKHATNANLEVPIWTPTGNHTIQVRVYAINAVTAQQQDSMENDANTEMKNYVAVGSDTIVVYGNVYGFQVYDVSDYPTWESVFRKDDSLELTGRTYTVGTRTIEGTANGHSKRATLPIIKGSHPTIDSAGPLSRGYAFRYRLTTTGDMYNLDDSISIVPTFYYVDKNGKNMQEVDLYYSQTINNRKSYLVKVGSILDTSNKHYLQTGDTYLTLPSSELSTTASLSGVSLASLKAQNKSVYSYGDIKIPSSLRTFTGKDKSAYTIKGETNGGSATPYASEATIKKSMQRWYAEYYLPSDVHAVPKGFDVASFGNDGAVDFEESFWLKGGYIVVNFDIVTEDGGKEELSYNPGIQGTVNMWQREGYQINRSDSTGAAFVFHEGDVVLYDTDNSASNDYDSSGTH